MEPHLTAPGRPPRSPEWLKPIPNVISVCRIGLALSFPFTPRELWLGLALTAGLSDAVDGFIARRYGATSVHGGLLDATADKLFTLIALVTFTRAGLIAAWQLPLLLVRDLFVAIACVLFLLQRRFDAFHRMQARSAGKITTFLLFGLMAALLLPIPALVGPFLALTMAGSALAAVQYAHTFRAQH